MEFLAKALLATLMLVLAYQAGKGSFGKQPPNENAEVDIARWATEFARRFTFWPTEILNGPEVAFLSELRGSIKHRFGEGAFPVFCQVPLGAMLASNAPNGRLKRTILSRRPDFVIVNYSHKPIIIIEYQGSGHGLRGEEETSANDGIKRSVAKQAGLKLIEIQQDDELSAVVAIVINELEKYKALGGMIYSDQIKNE